LVFHASLQFGVEEFYCEIGAKSNCHADNHQIVDSFFITSFWFVTEGSLIALLAA